MKTIFLPVEAKLDFDESVLSEINEKLPQKIAMVYSGQYRGLAEKIKEKLKKNVLSFVQVLGCSNPKFPKGTEAVLIIGEAKFHPVGIAYESKLPVYVLESNALRKVLDKDVEKLEKRERGTYLKYLDANSVGILISTKPGQQRLKKAIESSKKMKNKKVYFFISNNIDHNEFENFKIDSWVNTACPRMDYNDLPLVNLEKLEKNF